MIRITTLLWIALLVVAGGTVMHVSYQVRHVERHISELARNTQQEEDAIRILSAEWDTLNDPQRIDALAKRHLELQPTPIARIVTLDAIPLKLSEEQVARLSVASAKTQKAAAPAPAPHAPAKKPEILVSAPTMKKPAVQQLALPVRSGPSGNGTIASGAIGNGAAGSVQGQNAQDGVGLILARAERRR